MQATGQRALEPRPHQQDAEAVNEGLYFSWTRSQGEEVPVSAQQPATRETTVLFPRGSRMPSWARWVCSYM